MIPLMVTQVSISGRAWMELVLLALIWGASFLAFAVALTELPVATLVAHRVGWATILIWGFALLGRWQLPDPKFWGACIVMGILNNVIPFSLIALAQTTIESGLASILNASTAIFGILVAAIFFADEQLSWRKTIGVGLGFTGVIVAIGWQNLLSFDLRSIAQLAMLAATLSYAFAGVWARKTLSALPPQTAALGMLTGSSLFMIPFALIYDGTPSFSLSGTVWQAVLYLALIATTGAYLLYYRVLKMAGSGNLMLVTIVIVPIAIALGAIFLNETLPKTAYFGFALIAAGLMIIDGRVLSKALPKAGRAG